jgi:hypothetical protein
VWQVRQVAVMGRGLGSLLEVCAAVAGVAVVPVCRMLPRSLAVVGCAPAGIDSIVQVFGRWQTSQLARSFGKRMSSKKIGFGYAVAGKERP